MQRWAFIVSQVTCLVLFLDVLIPLFLGMQFFSNLDLSFIALSYI